MPVLKTETKKAKGTDKVTQIKCVRFTKKTWGWSDSGSVVKRIGSQLPVTPVLRDQGLWSPWVPGMQVIYIHEGQNTYTHKINLKTVLKNKMKKKSTLYLYWMFKQLNMTYKQSDHNS